MKIPASWQDEMDRGTEFGRKASKAIASMPADPEVSRQLLSIPPQNRPGDVLHNLLRSRYGATIASCKCQEWIDRMNMWGTGGCREHLEEIVDHLVEEASTNPSVSSVIRLALQIPFIGKLEGKRQLRNLVIEAINMAETAPHKHLSQSELEVRLQSPAKNWPAGWRDWPNVIEYHRVMLERNLAVAKSMSLPYHRDKSRAILIAAGGRCQIYDPKAPQYYFWGAFAAAWTLRHHGCTLPIEFWFLPGEMEEIPHVELFAKQVAATCHVLDTNNMRCVHGWQVKINAILQSKHTQILHIDADNIVAKDPTYLFDCQQFRDNEAMFWVDNPHVNDFHGRIIEHQWKRVGSSRTDRLHDIETGQMLIDKDRAAKALAIIKHFADRADYWEGFNGGEPGVWYGDKTSFHMGFILTETRHHNQKWNRWDAGGFYAHTDPSGDLLFQHACHRKGHLHNGHHIQNLKGNRQIEEAATFKSPLVFLDGSVEDSLRCIAPERMFAIEPDHISREVWMDVFTRNEYLLGPEIPADAIVVDIGANSGAFSYACLRRGAGTVVAFEPGPVAELARKNCSEFGERFRLIDRAVWKSDELVEALSMAPSHRELHSGSLSAVLPAIGNSITVKTIDLDTVLRELHHVHILKLDCEGAEYPILMTCSELHRVDHILGEYHHVDAKRSIDSLNGFLRSQGFEVYRIVPHGSTHGNFWAKRLA
jgi:FkbM family methyltransferase